MNIFVDELEADKTGALAERLYQQVFHDMPPRGFRPDFLLVARDADHNVIGYTSCREVDEDTVFSQFGGVMPALRKTGVGLEVGAAFLKHLFLKYSRVSTLCSNKNTAVIINYLKAGGEIVGMQLADGDLLLEIIVRKGEK